MLFSYLTTKKQPPDRRLKIATLLYIVLVVTTGIATSLRLNYVTHMSRLTRAKFAI